MTRSEVIEDRRTVPVHDGPRYVGQILTVTVKHQGVLAQLRTKSHCPEVEIIRYRDVTQYRRTLHERTTGAWMAGGALSLSGIISLAIAPFQRKIEDCDAFYVTGAALGLSGLIGIVVGAAGSIGGLDVTDTSSVKERREPRCKDAQPIPGVQITALLSAKPEQTVVASTNASGIAEFSFSQEQLRALAMRQESVFTIRVNEKLHSEVQLSEMKSFSITKEAVEKERQAAEKARRLAEELRFKQVELKKQDSKQKEALAKFEANLQNKVRFLKRARRLKAMDDIPLLSFPDSDLGKKTDYLKERGAVLHVGARYLTYRGIVTPGEKPPFDLSKIVDWVAADDIGTANEWRQMLLREKQGIKEEVRQAEREWIAAAKRNKKTKAEREVTIMGRDIDFNAPGLRRAVVSLRRGRLLQVRQLRGQMLAYGETLQSWVLV